MSAIQADISQLSHDVNTIISMLVQLGICTQQDVEDTRNHIRDDLLSRGGDFNG